MYIFQFRNIDLNLKMDGYVIYGIVIGGFFIWMIDIVIFHHAMNYLVEYFNPIQLDEQTRTKFIEYYYYENNNVNHDINIIKTNHRDCCGVKCIEYGHTHTQATQYDLYWYDFKMFIYKVICKKNYYCYAFLILIAKFIYLIASIPFGSVLLCLWIVIAIILTILIIFEVLFLFFKNLCDICCKQPNLESNIEEIIRNNTSRTNISSNNSNSYVSIELKQNVIEPIINAETSEISHTYSTTQENLPIATPILDSV